MKRRKRKKHTPDQMEQQRRGRRIFRALGRAVLTVIVLAAAAAAMTVFFKVKTVSVEGAMKYSADELIAGMDVQKGDNLYLWNKNRVITDLMHDFPYLESVQLRRRLPDALVLTVTECSAAVAVKNEDGTFTYISAAGKVLEQSTSDSGLPVVIGATLDTVTTGDFLQTATEVHTDAVLEILENLDAAGLLDRLRFINVQDLTDIRIGLGTQFDLRIGTLDDLAYRLRFAQTVIDERLSPSDVGRLYWDAQNRLATSPAYTNPDGEVGSTNTDGSDPDGTTDGTDTSDSSGSYDDGSSYDDSYDDGSYDDGSYDDSYDESDYDDSYDDSGEG